MTKIDGHKVHEISFNDALEIMRAHGYEDVDSLARMPDNPMQWKSQEWDLIFHLAAKCLKRKIDDAKKLKATTLVKILDHALKSSRIYEMITLLWQQTTLVSGSFLGAHVLGLETETAGVEVRGQE